MCEHPLTRAQAEWLLRPIEPHRVSKLTQGSKASYVAQHDIRAHLDRIFGFAGWSMDMPAGAPVLVFEEKTGENWKACYIATVRLTVNCSECGEPKASYTDSNGTGDMLPQKVRGDAHALAATSAVSTALKRAACCLGDQFGLSLYNKGQTTAFVKGTLVGPLAIDSPVETPTVVGLGGEEDATDVPSHNGTVPDAQEFSPEHLACEAELRNAYALEPADRIKEVARIKHDHKAILGETTVMRTGEIVTLARLADMVATGALSTT